MTNNQGFFYIINIKNNNFSEDGEMKIYVVGSSKNKFLPLDNIREKFLIDQPHEGDNIDFLNPWYCELTGLYYLWKHVDDEIVGLEHYRNYFWKNGHLINEKEINEELKKGDIICSGYKYPFFGNKILRTELNHCTKGSLNSFINVLYTYDHKLTNYFNKFLNGQKLWCCNCFIGAKKILDEWCEFIFDVLVDFEKKTKIGPGTNTLRREGYFTEFLFGAWLEYKGYKIIHCDMNKLTKDLKKTAFMSIGPNKQLLFKK